MKELLIPLVKFLRVTATAIVDELSSAAELVMGKTKKCPAAIIKNFEFKENTGNIKVYFVQKKKIYSDN